MLTNKRAGDLRERIIQLELEISQDKEELAEIESRCSHSWGSTTYAPIEHKAYTIPGDKPGTMGVDFRPSMYVPASTQKRWKRVCNHCGKIEYTERTQPTGQQPVF